MAFLLEKTSINRDIENDSFKRKRVSIDKFKETSKTPISLRLKKKSRFSNKNQDFIRKKKPLPILPMRFSLFSKEKQRLFNQKRLFEGFSRKKSIFSLKFSGFLKEKD